MNDISPFNMQSGHQTQRHPNWCTDPRQPKRRQALARRLALATVLALSVSAAQAQPVLYVEANAKAGGDGASWASAFNDLQDALAAATAGDQIWVAAGTYRPAGPDGSRAATFQLVSDVALHGGFAGGETSLDERDPMLNVTILSGDLNGDDGPNFANNDDNSLRVVDGSGTDATAVLDGFTVTRANGNGGMFNNVGHPTVSSCRFIRNKADRGGGMSNYGGSSPALTDCMFIGNAATGDSGAITYLDSTASGSSPQLTNCMFVANTATTGGAILTWNTGLVLSNCSFMDNTAPTMGGAIRVHGGDLVATDCLFTHNSNGAVTVSGGTHVFARCAFLANRGTFTGGAIHISFDAATLINCVFSYNTSSVVGGAISINAFDPGRVEAINCTFTRNAAEGFGGGIFSEQGVSLSNCVFWGNTDNAGLRMDESAQIYTPYTTTLNYSLVQGLTGKFGGVGNIADDPLFVDPDGDDKVIGTRDDDLRLQTGSPCIDAGDNSAIPAEFAFTDIDGNPRFLDDPTTPNSGAGTPPIVDMGAFEFWHCATPDDCIDGDACTSDDCVDGRCVNAPSCSDELFCNGEEPCEDGVCAPAESPCLDMAHCNETADRCFSCINDSECDDGRFCNGLETCDASGTCSSDSPCSPWEICNDDEDVCEDCPTVIFVDADATGANDGTSWLNAFTDLQNALATEPQPCGQFWVAEGIYTPAEPGGDRAISFDLEYTSHALYGGFAGDETNRDERDPAAHPTILSGDLNGDDTPDFAHTGDNACHVVANQGGLSSGSLLDGFTITGGNADCVSLGATCGGGVVSSWILSVSNCRFEGNSATECGAGLHATTPSPRRVVVTDCVFSGNRLTGGSNGGGGLYIRNVADLTIDSVLLADNTGRFDAGVIWQDSANLEGDLEVQSGVLALRATEIGGPGAIRLNSGATLEMYGLEQEPATNIVRSSILGPGDILIPLFRELRIEGENVIVDLSGQTGKGCADSDSSEWGTITVEGTLFVRDATIRNTNVRVTLAGLEGSTQIVNNDIKLLESSGDFGGEFFVEGGAAIQCNSITSYGDRYLDMDPDPDLDPRPVIEDNRIDVIITQGVDGDQGELLELRMQDFDCNPKTDPKGCPSGAFQVIDSPGYSDTWTLESLTMEPDAKLNLTNRPGFVFQDPEIATPETVYVKDLILGPGAVLNTALQRLYYQTLSMGEGAEIVDIPLLGFSLGVIELEDDTEFAVRVRTRSLGGSITRADGLDPADPNNGVLDMRTLAASSVAAKGAFARAGDEAISVVLKYRFLRNEGAELVVYLSDDPDVSGGLVEVATVRPPASGRAGSIGSSEFAVFAAKFPRGTLNFHHGTYIELELRGINSRLLIDTWDPQVRCSNTCADLDGGEDVTNVDFLRELAEYGRSVSPYDSSRSCLDSTLSSDGYVDIYDLWALDTFLYDDTLLNSCGTGEPSAARGCDPTGVVLPKNTLLVAGKPRGASLQEDALYAVSASGGCSLDPQTPASCPGPHGFRGNGRLVKKGAADVYQIHGIQGLVRLSDGAVVVPPDTLTFAGETVHIGVRPLGDGDFVGVPLTDAVFHPTQDDLLYVAPVLVTPPGGGTYKAAAKLRLHEDGPDPYTVEMLYGVDPADGDGGGCYTTTPPEASPCDVGRMRDIEIDRTGHTLFVTSAKEELETNNDNDWILMFDEASGAAEAFLLLSDLQPDAAPDGPVAMVVSVREDRLYLASSVNTLPDARTRVFRYIIEPPGTNPRLSPDGVIEIDNPVGEEWAEGLGHLATVTSMAEHPGSGALWVTGFTAPRFPDDAELPAEIDSIFTLATLAIVDPDLRGATVQAQAIECHDLALPIAAVFGSTAGCTNNETCDDGDVCSFDQCVDGSCSNSTAGYGDVAGALGVCGADGDVTLLDILAVLNGFSGSYAPGCERHNMDIAGDGGSCGGDGTIDLADILAVLDAFRGIDGCCAEGR